MGDCNVVLQWEHHKKIPGLVTRSCVLRAPENVDSRTTRMETGAARAEGGGKKKNQLHEKANRLSLEEATRRNMNLHSVAQDVTTPAPLENLFLKILESTSYPIKNITK